MTSAASQPPYADDVGRHLALDAEADGGVRADADGERQDEQEQLGARGGGGARTRMRAPVWAMRQSAARRARGRWIWLGGEVAATVRWASSRLPASMPSRTVAGVEVGEPVELRRWWSRRAWRGRGPGRSALSAAEDHDRAVLLADVVLVLAPATRPRRAAIQTRPTTTEQREQPRAARRSGAAAAGRSGPASGSIGSLAMATHGGRSSGISAATGSSSPVSPERWPRKRLRLGAAGRALRSSAAAPTSSGSAASSSAGSAVDDVGDDAGDVVGAAGLEAGADQLDRGVVGAARWRGCRRAGRRRATPQAPSLHSSSRSPRLELDVEQVGLGLVDAVERLEDQVAVRVDPRRPPR